MGTRVKLQTILEAVLGSKHVYFQPPETVKMQYPCIVYERSYINTKFADDNPYAHKKQYSVTLIDKDPDSVIVDKLSILPMCTFNRHYKADNLNHDTFDLYY